MNGFAANDLEAADLLALARLDDDGAPPAATPATGQGRHVISLAGAGQVIKQALDHRNPVTTTHLPGGEPEHVPNDQVCS